jgi:hypothetical protein
MKLIYKILNISQELWHMPLAPATPETEIRGSLESKGFRQNMGKIDPILKIKKTDVKYT